MSLQTHQLSGARGGLRLFDKLALHVGPGEALKVSGPNGAGKSTLLRMLCGLTEPLAGWVSWQGRAIVDNREAMLRTLFYLGHGSGLKDELTAEENLHMAAVLAGSACTMMQARRALEAMGLWQQAATMAGRLSAGQRRRVALARLMLTPLPQLLILDEPFNALDQAAVAQLTEVLHQRLKEGATLVYTTHQDHDIPAARHQLLALPGLQRHGEAATPTWAGVQGVPA